MNVLGPEFAHLQDVLTRKTKKLEGSLSEIKGALLEIKGLLEMKANAGSAQAVKLPDWETICRNVRRITSHTVTLSRQLDTLLQVLQDEKQSQLTAAKVVPTPTKSKNSFNAIFESDDDNLRPKDAVRLPDALKQQQQLTLALQLLLKSDKAPKIKVITSKQAAALPQSQSPHWTCPKCLIPNDEASAVCSACDTAREGESESRPSVFGSTASNTAGFGMGTNTATSTLMTKSTTATVFKVQAAVADWTCDVCIIKNPGNKVKCMACEAAKPSVTNEMSATAKTASAGTTSVSFAPETTKSAVSGAVGGFSFASVKSETASSGGFSFSSVKSAASTAGGFSFKPAASDENAIFRPAATTTAGDQWTCNVCMINNPSEKTKCMACEANKPGSKPEAALPAAAPASSGGFSFGAPKAVPATPLTGGFSFTPAKPDAPSGSGFTFAPAKSDAPASGGFSFNGSTSKPADAPKPATASLLPDWTCDVCMINNPSVKEKCMACEADKPGKKPAAASTPAASASGFSFGGPKTIEPAAPVTGDFSFTPAKPDAPSGSGFTFAPAKSDAPPAGGFTFETVKSDAATPGGFSFGAPALKSTEKLPMEAPKPVISSSASTWTCDVCMINNPGDKMKCMACEADKPGDQPLEEATKTAHATTPSIAATGFSFPAAKTPAAASTGFSFSTPTSSTPSSPPKATTGSFSFAPATLNAKKEPKAAAPKDASGFSFG
ncbi:hypothetical protein BC830DRAFT_608731 [Chytriomyces sp. MP71]|nr:hypothetical protein BC830DRAFT_608731 [Chytriomyces sp. MP71]